jgi:signal transduction histidine kinase
MKKTRDDIQAFGLIVLDQELISKKSTIESFVYNCSHGIRSPLKSMQGLVRLMKDCGRRDDWNECKDMLERAAERMQDILGNFHELQSNSSQEPKAERIEFRRMLDDVLLMCEQRRMDSGVVIDAHINQKGEFYSDTNRLKAVLQILISNAIAYHRPTELNKKIKLFVTASPANCNIQIHDNGVGIPHNHHQQIFELFFRGDIRSTGAGMGLYIAKQIIKKLNGIISVTSTEGVGSVFSISIPTGFPSPRLCD